MGHMVVKRLESLDALGRVAPAWDDLWRRSEITLPTARAELLTLWCECFAAERPFTALVVEHDGQWVGALPLVERSAFGCKLGGLPTNAWSPAGDLLLDPQSDVETVCELLWKAAGQCGWRLLWFDALLGGASRWQTFLLAGRRLGRAVAARERFAIDLVQIERGWSEYLANRSANHRRQLRKASARAEQSGPTRLVRFDNLSPQHVAPILRECFEIEAGGWKGRAQGDVFRTPGVWEFYLSQSRQLAAWGQLSLTLLEHGGRPIAFEYGWVAKGVYSSLKVGYDETFRRFSPGQMLRYHLFEQFHAESQIEWVDFLGPATRATSSWATHQYSVNRIVASNRGILGRSFVRAYGQAGTLVRRVRRGANDSSGHRPPRLGQAPGCPPCSQPLPAGTWG